MAWLDDENESEYDEEGASEDKDFIVQDEDAEAELLEARKREMKEARKKEKRELKRLKKRRDSHEGDELDEGDIDVIKHGRKGKRLQKMAPEEDPAVEQIDTMGRRKLKIEKPKSLEEMVGKRDESSTAVEVDPKHEHESKTAMDKLRDNFETQDIDDFLFCTQQDLDIEDGHSRAPAAEAPRPFPAFFRGAERRGPVDLQPPDRPVGSLQGKHPTG